MREIWKRLDEHFLVPISNRRLQVIVEEESVSIRFGERQYLLARNDVILLDLPNLSTGWWHIMY